MDNIVQDILTADLPVIVYVYPPEGRAASAGTFITLAGHVAAMAPGTSIGAATPVGAANWGGRGKQRPRCLIGIGASLPPGAQA